jgi:hypothetical protein
MDSAAEWSTERLVIDNPGDQPLTLVLEPWADEYELAPGNEVIIEAAGPAGRAGPDGWYLDRWRQTDGPTVYVIVWAWDCWDARVLRPDGTVIADWLGIPVGRFRELAGDWPPGVSTSRLTSQ